MAKLEWLKVGERFYETGISKSVLYRQDEQGAYPAGVPWNGLISVSENPSGAEKSPLYADDTKYLELMSAEEFGATIECYAYPPEFAECNGEKELAPGVTIGQQDRKPFGMSYKTIVGNDVKKNNYGYKLHLIYGATASPSEKGYSTVNDNPEAITFSFEVTTTPVTVEGHKPTASLTIESTKIDAQALKSIEEALYGTESKEAYLPLPAEIAEMINAAG